MIRKILIYVLRKEHELDVYKFEKKLAFLNEIGKEQKEKLLIFEKFFTDLLPK